jgi:single-strand DNA-binding protein
MLNRVCLQGRLTHEPEVRLTSSQTQYCNFRIACQRDFKKQDGTYDTDFIDCVAWRNTAGFIAKFFNKGDMIIVDGKLQVDNFKDKDGVSRSKYQVAVDGVSFSGDAARSTTTQQDTEPAPVEDAAESTEDSELPFEVG